MRRQSGFEGFERIDGSERDYSEGAGENHGCSPRHDIAMEKQSAGDRKEQQREAVRVLPLPCGRSGEVQFGGVRNE